MYNRLHSWTDAAIIASQSESGWTNYFAVEDEIIDLRIRLKGYGWKPLAGDQNLNALEKGSYRIYYRKNGDIDWTFLTRVESERAGQDVAVVYKDVGVALGVVGFGKYDFKIVADMGPKFTAWGGVIEGAAAGDQFWYGLQIRTIGYRMAAVIEPILISENVGVHLV